MVSEAADAAAAAGSAPAAPGAGSAAAAAAGAAPAAAVVDRLRAAGCVFAEDEARLLVAAASSPAELDELVARRVAGTPLEQVLGWAEFCGLRIAVEPGVFVPRRRTEFLARLGIDLARRVRDPVVVDLCCGSGAVGAAVAAAVSGVQLYATDVDPAAVRCARRNLSGSSVVVEGDLFAPLPVTLGGRVDVLVVNAPYVPTDAIATMPPEARRYEARVALDGGADGLDVQRRVVAGARQWLAPGGHLLVETSRRQAPGTVEVFARGGLAARVARSAELDATVVLGAVRQGDAPPLLGRVGDAVEPLLQQAPLPGGNRPLSEKGESPQAARG